MRVTAADSNSNTILFLKIFTVGLCTKVFTQFDYTYLIDFSYFHNMGHEKKTEESFYGALSPPSPRDQHYQVLFFTAVNTGFKKVLMFSSVPSQKLIFCRRPRFLEEEGEAGVELKVKQKV